ncbi:MAG: MFS transporter [Chloroflexi bacterium]|nr:MFS transporter [Chloroflexota bacterium]
MAGQLKAEQTPHIARNFVLAFLSGGHGVFHWYTQSFWVILPRLASDFALSKVQVGSLITMREMAAGLVNLPGGVAIDLLRRSWGLIMAGCIALLGVAYLAVASSVGYLYLLAAMALVGVPATVWHIPATTVLSGRFAERRGLAFAIHSMGGAIGDSIGPVVTGLLLLYLTWRQVLSIYALPPFFLAVLVWWALRGIGGQPSGATSRDLLSQIKLLGGLVRAPALILLMVIAGLRAMGHVALLTFLPLYLAIELGYSPPLVGFHIGLLTFLGVVSSPILGALSDRYGRRVILIPGLLSLATLNLALARVGTGLPLTIVIALLGLFVYSLQAIILAAAMDLAGKGVEGSTLGFLFAARFVFSGVSPLIAGAIYDSMGIQATFTYIAAVFTLPALILAVLPLHRPAESTISEPS